jgi:sulfate/thiosulfate transport system permease protein
MIRTAANGSAARPARTALPWGRFGIRFVAASYLGLAVLLPLAAVVGRGFGGGLAAFYQQITRPAALEALRLTLTAAAIMTVASAVFGTLTAYVLTRFDFPGRGLFNGIVELPFAIPTLVTGVMLVVLYGPQGVLGSFLEKRGVNVIFAKPGIVLALLFVCYPFVIRAVQPLLMGEERSSEQAAWTIGASRWRTFWKITLPEILPGVLTGSLLCFARALGEFGSIVVVAGNIPGRTLTAPVYIYGEIESQNALGASAVSIVLLATSFGLLLLVDWFGRRQRPPGV